MVVQWVVSLEHQMAAQKAVHWAAKLAETRVEWLA